MFLSFPVPSSPEVCLEVVHLAEAAVNNSQLLPIPSQPGSCVCLHQAVTHPQGPTVRPLGTLQYLEKYLMKSSSSV